MGCTVCPVWGGGSAFGRWARAKILSVRAMWALGRARTLTGEHGLVLHMGLQARVSAHGFLGFAAMTAATLRQAIEMAVHFAPTRATAIALRLETGARTAALVVEERASLGDARDAIVFSLLTRLWKMGNSLTALAPLGDSAWARLEPE